MKSFCFLFVVFLLSGIALSKDDNFGFFNLDGGNIQCLLAVKKYGGCVYQMTDLEEVEIAKVCGKFDNNQCKDFVKDVYKTTTGCENQSDKTLDSLIKRIRYVYIAGCSKDENGKLCPLTNLIQNRQNAYNTTDIDISVVQDSCSSKNCKKQLHNMIELLPYTKPYVENNNKNTNSTQDIPEEWIDATYKNIDTDKIKELLDSEVCLKMASGNNTVIATNSTKTEVVSNSTGVVSNSTEVVSNPTEITANKTISDANDNSSSATNILTSSNSNLIFATILLIILMNIFL